MHLSTCCSPDGREDGEAFLPVKTAKEEKLTNHLYVLNLGEIVVSIRCDVGGFYENKNVDSGLAGLGLHF